MRYVVHVRFGEERQRNSSTTLCLLLHSGLKASGLMSLGGSDLPYAGKVM